MKPIRNARRSLAIASAALVLTMTVCSESRAESTTTRSLYNAVCGFEFNEALASAALASGADINWQNPAMGDESMLITAIKGQKDSATIDWMIKHGANPSLKDSSGKSALDYALRSTNTSDGRKILALLNGTDKAGATAAGQAQNHAPVQAGNNTVAHQQLRTDQNGINAVDPTQNATRVKAGGLTAAQVKKTIETGFTHEYQNHFTGAENRVTIEWLAPIEIGAAQDGARMYTDLMYPVKIQVRLTVEDPRDGNRMSLIRGTNADYGFMKKHEMYRFFKNGFGDWEYGMYEI